ncbi:condensin complex subunit 3-like isoform X2 [Mya arenaria]|uniref:condensin complex subunit 3-like isoform X2 n=1 Tax=Mya arenaria TaxID=6604 RepID=UPI0022E8077F|nr:condensin complex subunit 3-like isoform X2 [Mya arenaria]
MLSHVTYQERKLQNRGVRSGKATMGDRTRIKEVFTQCQTGLQGHGKLMKTLSKVYEKTDFGEFWSEFSHCLKYAMVIFKREPAVERVIDFVAKFAPSLSKGGPIDGDEEDDETDSVGDNRLLQEMFDFLLSSHSARDRGVRFRCCQLINKLLTNLGEDAQIDDELYDRLYECMLDRLKDKCPVVRYHAVLAMARLQDPTDENCPVIRAYLFLLNCDPSHDVRRAVLTSIAPSTKTLSSVVGRTRDVKEMVRKTAYEVISEKIHIKALSIALRLQIVSEGLKDRSDLVRGACSGKLLQAWMRTFQGNFLDLLRSLDVEDSTDICLQVLDTLFKATTTHDLLERFDILNESLLIPEDQLTSESALYWRAVCKHFHAMGSEGDEYLEKVMPVVVDFCAFLQRYMDELKNIHDPEIQLGREFIIEQMLLITGLMDMADASSRKALETLLHNMLMAEHISHRLVKAVVSRVCELRGMAENMVDYFAEVVSEIREPITMVEKDIAEEQKRQINLKIAGIRVELNQLREDLDEAVRGQDFTRAAEIKGKIAQLDLEKNALLETSEPVREEIRAERNDPLTILKCQTIISEMLQLLKMNAVSPTLQMMIESQIVPGIQNEDAEVRNMAMRALGLCCYLSKDLLVTYIPLFMQASQIDVEGVRVTALQVLFDLLLLYGLDIVDASESSSTESTGEIGTVGEGSLSTERTSEDRNGTASKLVAIICSFLDGEVVELRTCAAEGLSKLLLSGRVVSSKILSHLILLWYNPLSEDDTHLRDCLGTFFPLYALASRSNQEVVEDAFLPTLKTLLRAPSTSPLADVNVNNVAELLVQLTNSKLITVNQNQQDISQDNPGHDNLTETVCNEILSAPDSPNVRLWLRILNQMEVSPDNEVLLKDLRILAYKMVKTVKDRISLRGLEKFQATINSLASKFVSNDDDLENIEIEPVAPTDQTQDVADETADTTQTPKRKRVRGLYSQNMTLGLEMESELDTTAESPEPVDASCLMRTNSSVSESLTPSRPRPRSNTTTELAEEEVFTVPEAPEASKKKSTAKGINGIPEVNEEAGKSTDDDSEDEGAEPATKDKSPSRRGRATEKSGRNLSKKQGSPRKESKSKSPVKSGSSKSPEKVGRSKSPQKKQPEKRKASKSPDKTSPGKRIVSASPARQTQQKRKASQSPGRERKRMSKSPVNKGAKKTNSRSPEKRKLPKTPIKETSEKGSKSKSPRVERPLSPSKSPAKKAGESKKKPTSARSDKEEKNKGENKEDKSPKKKETQNTRKAAVKPVTIDTPSTARAKTVTVQIQANEKKAADRSLNATQSPRTSGRSTGKKSSGTETPEVAKGRSVATRAAVGTPGSATGKRSSARIVADTPEMPSPRKTRRAGIEESVAETPEPRTAKTATKTKATDKPSSVRRASARGVANSPAPSNGPSEGSKNAEKSTPRSSQASSTRSSQRSVPTPTPTSTRSAKRANAVASTPSSTPEASSSRHTTRRNQLSSQSSQGSQSDSSSDKSASMSVRMAKSKTSSTGDSSSSDSSKVTTKPKSAPNQKAPVERLFNKASSQTTDDEEDKIKRKARPSRRSANISVSMTMTPPSSARRTRASLSQSSVESPGTSGKVKDTGNVVNSSRSASRGQDSSATRRSTRGDGDASSQASSKIPSPGSSRSTRSEVSARAGSRSAVGKKVVAPSETRSSALRKAKNASKSGAK